MITNWIEINDLSGDQYSVNKNILFKTSMLRSDLRFYSHVYIVVKRTITVKGSNENNRMDKILVFKNNTPFRSFIYKINSTFVDNAEDIDIIMSIYNLLENSDNYAMNNVGLNILVRLFMDTHFMANDPVKPNSNNTRTINICLMNPRIYTISFFFNKYL